MSIVEKASIKTHQKVKTFHLEGEIGLRNLKNLVKELGDGYVFRFIDNNERDMDAILNHGTDKNEPTHKSHWEDEEIIMRHYGVAQGQFTFANDIDGVIRLIEASEGIDLNFDRGGFMLSVYKKSMVERLICKADFKDDRGEPYFAYRFLDGPKECLFGLIIIDKAPLEKIFPDIERA